MPLRSHSKCCIFPLPLLSAGRIRTEAGPNERRAHSLQSPITMPPDPTSSPSDDELFREITEHVCGTLSLDEALAHALPKLAQRIPADALFLIVRDCATDYIRPVAYATNAANLEKDERFTSDALIKVDGSAWHGARLPAILNRPAETPHIRQLFQRVGLPTTLSVLSIRLDDFDGYSGSLGVFANGNDQYTPEHARVLDLLRVPFNIALINALRYEQAVELRDRLHEDNLALRRRLHQAQNEVVGAQNGLRHVMDLVERVAPTQSPVLLQGETGVGKEVIATTVHDLSPRRNRPMVSINCGAIPESLIESELFGHERGAFTDASSTRIGLFERAAGSTVFLDEVGELPMAAQSKLLRVLQSREFERIGGAATLLADVRVIAATHRELEGMVSAGTFREDLYYRLNVYPIHIPPLRQRADDIPLLVTYFMESRAREMNLAKHPRLAENALEQLLAYPWPGNVRELRNVIERALILYQDEPLQFLDLATHSLVGEPGGEPRLGTLREAERTAIMRAIEAASGKIKGRGGAAELLGLNPSTLRNKMLRLGIHAP